MAMGIASALMGAVALGATALIVPGTGTPEAQRGRAVPRQRLESLHRRRRLQSRDCADPDLVGIDYPASFWPLTRSSPDGASPVAARSGTSRSARAPTNLITQLTPFLDEDSDEDVYIFGYSQGGAVVANTLEYLGASTWIPER